MKDSVKNYKAVLCGAFQIGKSSLVNALLGHNVAEMGRGVSTTHECAVYPFSERVTLVDTPGFGAEESDDNAAQSAIDTADLIIIVQESNSLGEDGNLLLRRSVERGVPIAVLLNCKNKDRWAPEENNEVIQVIEAEIANSGSLDYVIPIAGRKVFPINILWARYAVDIMSSDDKYGRVKTIEKYAANDLKIENAGTMDDGALRHEFLKRSGFLPVKNLLENLPFELVKHTVSNPQWKIKCLCERFSKEFERNWSARKGA